MKYPIYRGPFLDFNEVIALNLHLNHAIDIVDGASLDGKSFIFVEYSPEQAAVLHDRRVGSNLPVGMSADRRGRPRREADRERERKIVAIQWAQDMDQRRAWFNRTRNAGMVGFALGMLAAWLFTLASR